MTDDFLFCNDERWSHGFGAVDRRINPHRRRAGKLGSFRRSRYTVPGQRVLPGGRIDFILYTYHLNKADEP